MNIDLTVVNATFGHVAPQGAPALTDALSDVIERPPGEPQAQAHYVECASAAGFAERYLARANERLVAIGDVAAPYIGKRYTAGFVETANAADLMIASDILMALLLDTSLHGSEKLKSLLGLFLPEGFERCDGEHSYDITGSPQEVFAILALRQGVEPQAQAALAAWHDGVLGTSFAAAAGEGFLADAALVREQLFETYLDRDCDVADDVPASRGALLACCYAVVIGPTLAVRARRCSCPSGTTCPT